MKIAEPNQALQHTGLLVGLGGLLLLLALCLQFVTLASQDYRVFLLTALLLILSADVCFVLALMRGGFAMRCFSIVLMLPTILLVADFMRRAPHSFR
jgi:hypothetical protein